MSWSAVRYRKTSVLFQDRRRAKNDIRSKGTMRLRADDQRVVMRLAMEVNEAVEGGALESIFGSSSAAYVLRVMLRIKRAKGRDAFPAWENFSEGNVIKARRHLRGRNIHHMTPKSREGQLFFGNGTSNLLLMRVPRHTLLHREFGVRTWEEIILLLSRCVRIAWHAGFGNMVDSLAPAPPPKKMCRRITRRSLNNFQLFGESSG